MACDGDVHISVAAVDLPRYALTPSPELIMAGLALGKCTSESCKNRPARTRMRLSII